MSGEEDFDLFGDDAGEAEEYEQMMAEKKALAEKAKAGELKKGDAGFFKSSIVLDIKPADSEINYDDLVAFVTGIEMDGLEWKANELKPMAFGLQKLTVLLHAIDDILSIDDLTEKLEDNEDLVGSVEIVSFSKL